MTQPVFRGAGYFEHLRTRLWDNGAVGRASVMIGAGFSLNAEKISETAPAFPVLKDYLREFAPGLGLSLEEGARLPIDRLAGEFEASFGREALNEVIQRLIPWRQHRPGKLHHLLLDLPWADIFSTNYDPLLEDARREVPDRHYDLITHPNDIPTTSQPRIVKLHGSFPSSRPFIITEEDFRSYPRKFSPFVNLVQQSMMENALCLLGFSGDDPNFLRWAGWIRDELAEHRPQIYLVGVLDLPDGRRRYLENMQITPIDLGELFPPDGRQPAADRHQQALEWFLRSLALGRPTSRTRWPSFELQESHHQLSIPLWSASTAVILPERKIPDDDDPGLNNLYHRLRSLRQLYPGWELCPPERRAEYTNSEWQHFSLWEILEKATQQPRPFDLLLAREVLWSMKLTGVPLTPSGVAHLEEILGRYSHDLLEPSQPELLTLSAEMSVSGRPERVSWVELKEAWVQGAFAQLLEAREDLDGLRFNRWIQQLASPVQERPSWKAHWHWEQVRWALQSLDRQNALDLIQAWPECESEPFWEARRAMALAELGELADAQRFHSQALKHIRASRIPGVVDYPLYSKEAWMLYQARLLDIASGEYASETSANPDRHARQEKLRSYLCDVWQDRRSWQDDVERAYSKSTQRAADTLIYEFDPRVTRRVIFHGPSGSDIDQLASLRLLRLDDWAAIPIRVDNVTTGREVIKAMCSLLAPHTPRLSVLTAVRSGEDDALNTLLSREWVAQLSNEDTEFLITCLHRGIVQAFAHGQQAPGFNMRASRFSYSSRVMIHGMEALARLVFRADETQRKTIFELTRALGESPITQKDRQYYAPLSNLLNLTILAMSIPERLNMLREIITFPLPQSATHSFDNWPDPFEHQAEFTFLQQNQDLPRLTPVDLQDLFHHAGDLNLPLRRLALKRLSTIYQLALLTEDAQARFGALLWTKCDQDQLPIDTPFFPWAFLRLPHPAHVDPEMLLKQYFLHGSAFEPPIVQTARFPLDQQMGPVERLHLTLRSLTEARLQWRQEERQNLLQRIQGWWPTMSKVWKVTKTGWGYLDNTVAGLLLRAIQQVIVQDDPELRDSAEPLSDDLKRYFSEEGFQLPPTADATTDIAATESLINALLTGERDTVVEAISETVGRLVEGSLPVELRQSLVSTLISRVIYRSQPGLEVSLEAVVYLIEHHALDVEPGLLSQLYMSLSYLARSRQQEPPQTSQQGRSEASAVRAAASKLAAAFYQAEDRFPRSPVLEVWKGIGLRDHLPEIRTPWSFLTPLNDVALITE